jgi:hypothetical protein
MARTASRNAGEGGGGERGGRGGLVCRIGAAPVPVVSRGSNYNKKSLKRAVAEVRPIGPLQWKQVAVRYKEFSGESLLRNDRLLKKAWFERYCKSMKPQTGTDVDDFVTECQEIQRDIMDALGAAPLLDRVRLTRRDENEGGNNDMNEGGDGIQENESNHNYEDEDMEDDEDDEDGDNVVNQAVLGNSYHASTPSSVHVPTIVPLGQQSSSSAIALDLSPSSFPGIQPLTIHSSLPPTPGPVQPLPPQRHYAPHSTGALRTMNTKSSAGQPSAAGRSVGDTQDTAPAREANSTMRLLIQSMQLQIQNLQENQKRAEVVLQAHITRAEEERKRIEERLWQLTFAMLQRGQPPSADIISIFKGPPSSELSPLPSKAQKKDKDDGDHAV